MSLLGLPGRSGLGELSSDWDNLDDVSHKTAFKLPYQLNAVKKGYLCQVL
ncbi:MAG: hypothetical protein HXS54_01615 [Theionarchaea archaeon]|nr:hypothetical protein [Theionarchaea archaeon]